MLALAPLPVGASLALLAGVAVFGPVFNGASTRLIAEQLTGDAYVLGRSLSSVAAGGAQLLGLAFGGAAVAVLGPGRTLLVAAAVGLLAAVWVRLRLPDFPAPAAGSGSALGQGWSVTGRLVAVVIAALAGPLVLLAVPVPAAVAMAVMFLAGAAFCHSMGVQRPFLAALAPQLRGQAFALQFTGLMTMQGACRRLWPVRGGLSVGAGA